MSSQTTLYGMSLASITKEVLNMNEKAALLVKACEEAGVLTQIVRDQDIYIEGMSPEQASNVVSYIQKAGDTK